MADDRQWWFGVAQDDHFRCGVGGEDARRLFAESAHVVSIECSSHCNRRCPWCSNAWLPRTERHYLDVDLYRSILAQLAEIGWAGKLVYSSAYNEPLANPDFVQRVREAREALPDAMLHTHTNGDFLTCDMLDALRYAGLSRLYVMSYDGREGVRAKARQLGVPAITVKNKPGWYECYAGLGYLNLRFIWRDFDINGMNRGGLIRGMKQPPPRQVPCFEPFWHFNVESTGRVVPCCHIRTDAPQHKDCYTADLNEQPDIFAAYTSDAAVGWRRSVIGFGGHRPPCDRCDWKANQRFNPPQAEAITST